ncbi:DUF6188 family protein [Pseudoalteromonas luteoviolacea]|nr:DUF6188 family protein [Pseudoalteromonas luteoviolacea]
MMSSLIENANIASIAKLNDVWLNIFLSNQLSIAVESFFRFLDVNGNIEITSDDWCSSDYDERSLEIMNNLIVGATVKKAIIKEKPGDLVLVLSNGITVEIFAHSSTFESWSINGKQGTILEVTQNRGVQKYS